ncbi:MAG TPA: tRNA pseudouridine(55) synthase TruB [Firmicutes bacterium]|nr:tRNA pseudouridine(55) synthase TruB [Bacillota bacterium]
MTSHDVVSYLRRLTGMRRIGHTGTLDPGAAGVLVVCLGRATRLVEYLVGYDKRYRVEITFGQATDTMDGEGQVIASGDASSIDEQALRRVAMDFTGQLRQVPPRYSAVKVAGQPAYRRARRGEPVELPVRQVRVDELRVLRFWPGEHARALLDVRCASGTFVRSLCHDMGEALGCPAHMSFLVRLEVGPFPISTAQTLAELAQLGPERLAEVFVDVGEALPHLPAVAVNQAEAEQICHGRFLPWAGLTDGQLVRVEDANQGRLLAIARYHGAQAVLKPEKVLC